MTMTPPGYRPRLIDKAVSEYLEAFGALLIEGPKWCGKTWSSLHHARSVFYVDDPDRNYANRTSAQLNPSGVLLGDEPRLIDEWQQAPGVWDAVRFAVDQGARQGRFILTGSSSADAVETSHSGIGRIGRLSMRTMSLFESGESTGSISLAGLINQGEVPVQPSFMSLEVLASVAVRGGWPGSLGLPSQAAALLPRQYLMSLAQKDISQLDGVRRDPRKALALLSSIARNTGQLATNVTIERDIAQNSEGERLSTQAIATYLAKLRALFVIEELPGWAPALRSPIRLRSSPKRYMVDPSLAVAGLEADAEALLRDTKTLGLVFENLVIRDLMVYAAVSNARLSYYLDGSQLEADVILSLGAERWAAIEVKLSSSQEDEAAEKLLRLQRKLTERGAEPPLFLAVITGVGSTSHRREDGVCVVPIDLLGP